MFKIPALLFVAIGMFQFAIVVGSSQDAVGAGDCDDFIEYDVHCPPGPGTVCENNTYDSWSSHQRCHILMEEVNANVAQDPSGDCDTYKDANDDPCPFPVPFDGNYRNAESGCTKFPCVSPL